MMPRASQLRKKGDVMANHLITSSGSLLDEQGRLREPGYALRPPFYYDHARIAAPKWRIKDWDYYLVNDDAYAVALTFSDLGYIGLVSASVMDFATSTFKTSSALVIAPMGKMGVPSSSDVGDIVWQGNQCKVEWRHRGQDRRLSFFMREFDDGEDLEVEVLLYDPPRDSMVICTPWAEDETAFYYNRKIVGMKARGAFRRGALFHEFAPEGEDGPAFGLLDWGRGVWTYDNVWYWGVAQGVQEGPDGQPHVLGLNLGYGFGDTSAASENMVFVDGIAHKLDLVDFGIPGTPDAYRYLEPWHMTSNDGRLELTFTPEIDRVDDIAVLGIVKSEQHQVFGKLDGFVVLDDGTRFEVRGLRASAEHIHNRY